MHRYQAVTIVLLTLAGTANVHAQAGQPAAPQATATRSVSWSFEPSLLSELRAGGQLNTQADHPSGGAVEITFGYQFRSGLTPVIDFATSVMFDDVGSGATLWYLRAGGGLRYTAPLSRIRPWGQATYGFLGYSVKSDSSADVTPGHGLSLTAGCDFGLTTYSGYGVWLGLSGGADIGFYKNGEDVPARLMLTLGFHR